jgi:hypothetical protein
MTSRHWLLVPGAIGATGAVIGCKDQPVREYLAQNGPMSQWQGMLARAVCQLETRNPAGLDPAKMICPSGPIDADGLRPPTFP